MFKDIIRAWKRTTPEYKTWDYFKHDLREARIELRETGTTIDKLGFHNANAIVDKMMVRLQIKEDKHTATTAQHVTDLASANQANATMESQMQTLLSQVHSLYIASTHGNENKHGKNFGRICGCGRGRGASRVIKRGREHRQSSTLPTPKYFWTHGNCVHGSEECTYPFNGHNKDATFAHMMGGNTNRCYSITKLQVGEVDLRNKNKNIITQ